ncbi:chromosome segregation protein SMC [bacterium]|nr:chromosome segregation protein SMC [bacterium]
MFLAKLTIHGFKSFARKTELSFSQGLSAVVGPNGCGKTNILDAIRWVIGEQKVKSLRSTSMQDVIFEGTREQKPMGMAEVQIKLKDCKGLLPYDPMEETVIIGRRYFRTGDSEYLVNGRQVRLKDIQSILMGTGIGNSVYALIEQSMIQRILSGRKDDRRALFEEAAGIMKYKLDRRASESKLKNTEDDLTRLGDIITEVENNVNFLKRQMRRAQDLKRLKKRAAGLAVKIADNEYHHISNSLSEIAKKLSLKEEETAVIHAKKTELETRRQVLSVDRDEKEVQVSKTGEVLRKIESEMASGEKEFAVLQERIINAESGIETSNLTAKTQETHQKELVEQINKTSGILGQKQSEFEKTKNKTDELIARQTDSEKGYSVLRKEVIEFRGGLGKAESAFARTSANIDSAKRQLLTIDGQIDQTRKKSASEIKILEEKKAQFEIAEKQQGKLKEEYVGAKTHFENSQSELAEIRTNKSMLYEEVGKLGGEVSGLRAKLKALEENAERGKLAKPIRDKIISIGGAFGQVADLLEPSELSAQAIDLVLGDLSRAWVVQDKKSAALVAEIINKAKASAIVIVLEELPKAQSNAAVVKTGFEAVLSLLDGFSSDEVSDNFVAVDGDYLRAPGIRKIGKLKTSPVTRFTELKSLRKTLAEIEKIDFQANENLKDSMQKEKRARLKLDESKNLLGESEKRFYSAERQHREREFDIRTLEGSIKNADSRIGEFIAQRDRTIASITGYESSLSDLHSRTEQGNAQLKKMLEKQEKAEVEVRDCTRLATNYQMEYVRAKGVIEGISRELERLELQRKEASLAVNRAKQRAEQLEVELGDYRNSQEKHRERIRKLFGEKEEAENSFNKTMEDAREVNDMLRKVDVELRETTNNFTALEKIVHEKTMEKHDQEIQIGWLKKNLLSDYSIDIEKIDHQEKLSEVEEQKARNKLDRLKGRIADFGGVDPESEVKYEEELNRFEFMTTQRKDLLDAGQELKKTIRRLDNIAREEFLETFEKTRLNFRQIFTELFEGGEADLKLEEGVDVLEADIEIAARPRGKRFLSINKLSQGEKALCALSLLFGLYKVKPSPFCMLDEVDAPLDDANVNRFLRLIRRFAQDTQFILITHNKKTMEATDFLYGITMQEHGISKAISLKLADLALDFENQSPVIK